jgi:LDH2 family malate/lactate/ureidoglycolate dehydrogenase
VGVDAQGFGITYTAIDPEGFCPIADFKTRIDSLVQQLKAVPPRPDFAEILVPGELEWRTEARRRRDGIFVDAPFWKDMVSSAVELDVEIDDLPV